MTMADSGVAAKKPGDEHAGHKMTLPAEFRRQVRGLEAAYDQVAQAVQQQDAARKPPQRSHSSARRSTAVDGSLLTGHPRMVWKEFAMLLGNDAVEGRDARQPTDIDRVFLLLKGHMRRVREQLGVMPEETTHVEHHRCVAGFSIRLGSRLATVSGRRPGTGGGQLARRSTVLGGVGSGSRDDQRSVARGSRDRSVDGRTDQPRQTHRATESGTRHPSVASRVFRRFHKRSACWPRRSALVKPIPFSSCTARWRFKAKAPSGIRTATRREIPTSDRRCSSAPIASNN